MPYKNIQDRKNYSKRYQQSQKFREYDWGRAGIKLIGTEYDRYEATTNCDLCNVELVGGHKSKCRKTIDHDHLSGYVRNILCNTCNVNRRVIDTRRLKLHAELHRYYWRCFTIPT